jgi:transposase
MPKKITIDIKESAEFLYKTLSESEEKLKQDKIKTLLHIKEKKFHFQSDIGENLERTEKTIRAWIQEYSENGYSGLLKVKRGGNNTRTISAKAIKHISKFIKHVPEKEGDANMIEFSSFIELKSKLEERLGETINYDALYSHFRRNYKTEYKILIKIFSHNRRKKEISRRLSKQIEKQFV